MAERKEVEGPEFRPKGRAAYGGEPDFTPQAAGLEDLASEARRYKEFKERALKKGSSTVPSMCKGGKVIKSWGR